MKYYGQWETDMIIEQYFPGKKNGSCIEVGAYDGIKGSNTLFFERLGWDCLCIEPNPNVFERLKANRKNVIRAACSNYTGTNLLTVYDFHSGTQSSLTSLDTDKRLIRDYDSAINLMKPVKVSVYTLGDIIECIWQLKTEIDFISIDTEGTELSVLKGMHWDHWKVFPRLLVVENNYNDHYTEGFLMQHGYRLDKRYRVNDFYVRNK